MTVRGPLEVMARSTAESVLGALGSDSDVVVCDLTRVTGRVSPKAAEAMAVAAVPVRQWGGTLLVFVCPDDEFRDDLGRQVHGNVLLTTDRAVVRIAMDGRQRPVAVTRRLPLSPHSSRLARELVSLACAQWDCLAQGDTARIIAAELVTNAVVHARTGISFTIARSGPWLRLSVRDGSGRVPHPQTPDATQANGRGLLLVLALSEAWGVLPLRDGGKVTWALIPADVNEHPEPAVAGPDRGQVTQNGSLPREGRHGRRASSDLGAKAG